MSDKEKILRLTKELIKHLEEEPGLIFEFLNEIRYIVENLLEQEQKIVRTAVVF